MPQKLLGGIVDPAVGFDLEMQQTSQWQVDVGDFVEVDIFPDPGKFGDLILRQ